MFIFSWKISKTQVISLKKRECLRRSGPVHWDDPERWDGEAGGRGIQDGGHMYTHGWFMSMYGKIHYNIVISLQLKKKRMSQLRAKSSIKVVH